MVPGTPPSGYELSDADLVCRARAGARPAFDALYHRHYGRIYNFALRLEGGRDAAEEVAQAAFVRAWRAIGGMEDGQAFLRWMYRITVNITRDRAKRARRKPWVSWFALRAGPEREDEGLAAVELADAAADPARLTLVRQRDAALKAAIARLPMTFREVVVLHHIDDLDVRELAQALGIPEGTVKSRLARGRAQLRTELRDWLEDET